MVARLKLTLNRLVLKQEDEYKMTAISQDLCPKLSSRKVYVVTGAASGIGAAVAERLIAANELVVGVDISWVEDKGHQNQDSGQGFIQMNCDVSDWSQVSQLAKHVDSTIGPVSGLVNCAGIGLWFSPIAETSVENWERVIAVNLRGPFLLAKAFLPSLISNQGVIVMISSVHGVATSPGCGAYASSKAGLFGLTKALAVDYGEKGVRTNCLLVGSVDTQMTQGYESEAKIRGVADLEIPEWQRTNSSGIASIVEFMLSESAGFINGSLFTVDGGLLSRL